MLLAISVVVNGCYAVNTKALSSFVMRESSPHNLSSGIKESHFNLVVPYGKSAKTISTELSSKVGITSRQSPQIIVSIIAD